MRDIIVIVCLAASLTTASCACQNRGPEGEPIKQTQIKGIGENKPAGAVIAGPKAPKYAPDEVLVGFRQGTDPGEIESIQKDLHLETIRIVSGRNIYLMKILDGSPVEAVIEKLRRYRQVSLAEPNYLRKID